MSEVVGSGAACGVNSATLGKWLGGSSARSVYQKETLTRRRRLSNPVSLLQMQQVTLTAVFETVGNG